jgi:ABC-type dipeptide/oligopeptide/nickel transport system permease component
VYFRTWFVFKYNIFPPVELTLGDDVTVLLQSDTVTSILPAMVLPLLILVLVGLARPLFLMRDQMTLVAEEPFVLTARAKGLSEKRVHSRHIARNALLPLLNDASINLAIMFGGGILIEYIFAWPGIGMVLRNDLQEDHLQAHLAKCDPFDVFVHDHCCGISSHVRGNL